MIVLTYLAMGLGMIYGVLTAIYSFPCERLKGFYNAEVFAVLL